MQTKLTLRLDDQLIARAKAFARERGLSLSELVADFFEQLTDRRGPPDLSPWTQSLAGIAAPAQGEPPTDDEIRAAYLAHLEAKHH